MHLFLCTRMLLVPCCVKPFFRTEEHQCVSLDEERENDRPPSLKTSFLIIRYLPMIRCTYGKDLF